MKWEMYSMRRILPIFIFACLLSDIYAANYDETTLLSINKKNISVGELFKEIESRTEYSFFYNDNQINTADLVNVDIKNGTIHDVLKSVVEETNYSYRIIDKQILISKRKEHTNEHSLVDQVNTITGIIKDPRGEPIIGANIMIKGTTIGVISDIDGKFSINANPNSILKITYIGYSDQEIRIDNRTYFEIELLETSLEIEEVVVVGYGTQRKSDVTGSLSVVKAEDLLSGSNFNPLQGLKGKAAGVNVFTSTGNPLGINEAAQRIMIRGMNSINTNTNPLFVVDGVQMDNIQFINPNDIERIEVLKDASSTAVYGARGDNGVILVTTKRGATGSSDVVVSYEGWVSLGTISKYVPVMNAYEFMEMEERGFKNIAKYQQGRDYLAKLGVSELFVDKSDPLLFDSSGNPLYNTNWQKEATRSAWSHNHQLNIQQQGKKSSSGVFLNYSDQQGIMLNNYAKRLSARYTLDANPLQWLSINSGAMVTHMWGNGIDDSGGGLTARRTIWEMLPILPVKFPDGTWSTSQFKGSKLNIAPEAMTNPVHELTERERGRYRTKIFGNLAFIFHIADGLDVRTQLGVDANINTNKDYIPNNMINISTRGSANITDVKSYYWQEETYLNYNKLIDKKHRVNAMLGMSWSKSYNMTSSTGTVQDFDTNFFGVNNLGAGKTPSAPSSYVEEWSMNSYFGRGSYSFKDKYLATITLRVDGSSRFGDNNKYAFFPSFGLGWVLTSEDFMKNTTSWLSYLKLRSSYGRTGNSEITPYSSLATISSGTYLLNGNRVAINEMSRMPNPDLQWEKTDQFDVGFDLRLFKDRLNIEMDYYYKKTHDLLLARPLPLTTGFNTVMDNIGRVDNSGIDLMITSVNVENSRFKWETTFNMNYNKNVIKKLGENNEDILTNPAFVGGNVILRVGESMGSFYGYERLGTWSTAEAAEAAKLGFVPGEAKRSKDRKIIGKGMPDISGSFINRFYFDNWDFLLDLQYVLGVDTWQLHYHTAEDRTGYINGLNTILHDSWTENNQNTMVQQIRHRVFAGHNTTADSRWVANGSYLRGNVIQLGYTFSKKMLEKFHLKGLRLHVSVNNAFVIHSKDFTSYDPEGSSNADRFGQNIFFYQYPTARTYSFGAKLNF